MSKRNIFFRLPGDRQANRKSFYLGPYVFFIVTPEGVTVHTEDGWFDAPRERGWAKFVREKLFAA